MDSFLSKLNSDGDDDELSKELGQSPLSGFRTVAQLLFYEIHIIIWKNKFYLDKYI